MISKHINTRLRNEINNSDIDTLLKLLMIRLIAHYNDLVDDINNNSCKEKSLLIAQDINSIILSIDKYINNSNDRHAG